VDADEGAARGAAALPGPAPPGGGRRRRPVETFGAEQTLQEFEQRSRRWVEFYEGAWSKVRGQDWKKASRDPRKAFKERGWEP
jgi:hypothetical protein